MKIFRSHSLRAVALALSLVTAANLCAQSEESELPPPPGQFEAAPHPRPVQPFIVPDVPQALLDQTYLGVNWWATRRIKLGFGWSHTTLDHFGTTGVTDSYLTRLQWIY